MPTVAIANATMENSDSSSVKNRGRACARVSTSSINLTSAKGREGSIAFNCSRSLAAVVREQLNAIDPSLPLADVRLMEDVLTRAQARPRFLTLLLSLFSIVAFAIATVGIYGVVSYSVARRTKEFGLRMVLGAQGGDVLGLVMKQGAGMVVIGIVAGLATAFALTRLMASLLFGVTATDPPTFAGVTVVLFGVALAACYVP